MKVASRYGYTALELLQVLATIQDASAISRSRDRNAHRIGMGNCEKIVHFQSLLRRSIIYGYSLKFLDKILKEGP